MKKQSTTDAKFKYKEDFYTAIDNEKNQLSIFLDFSKASNTVDHMVLSRKRESYMVLEVGHARLVQIKSYWQESIC